LLWWRPLVGCTAGITFALLELAFFDEGAAHVAWALHGAACLVVAAWLLWSRWRQRAGVGSLAPHHVTPPPVARSVEFGIPVAAALLCALAAAGLTYYTWNQFASDDLHRQAAVRVDGRVSAVDDEEYTVTVRVPSGDDHTFYVLEIETYPGGPSAG
jgi:hypothetical protein